MIAFINPDFSLGSGAEGDSATRRGSIDSNRYTKTIGFSSVCRLSLVVTPTASGAGAMDSCRSSALILDWARLFWSSIARTFRSFLLMGDFFCFETSCRVVLCAAPSTDGADGSIGFAVLVFESAFLPRVEEELDVGCLEDSQRRVPVRAPTRITAAAIRSMRGRLFFFTRPSLTLSHAFTDGARAW